MVLETFRQALQNVWSNKLRTFLTMLGIIIGVMAVIVIVGLGNGMTRSMRDSFSAMGTNTLSIQIWGYGSRTATVDDLYDIVKKNPELLSSISPQLDFSDNTPKVGTTQYRYGTVYGVDENYIESKGYTLAKGRNIQYMDITDNKQICVIGDYINRTAYGGTLGIVLGYIVSAIANQVLPMFTDGMDVTVSPSFNSIVAAFGISVFIGVLFGYLPAKRAARLNPIDALRYD